VVLESTYGDRDHEDRRERRERLKTIVEGALANRGTVLIPAFSIGRTQELLYDLEHVLHQFGRDPLPAGARSRFDPERWEDLEIVLDSPLASRFTALYRKLSGYWDAEARRRLSAGRHPLAFEQLTTVDSHQDHLAAVDHLRRTARPCIVIAASGMCTGGRVVNYLKALLEDPRHDIVFVGYQARGTPGQVIQRYGPRNGYVDLDGSRYTIRARVHSLTGYSAHAGQKDLLNFVRRMRHPPREVRLVHGEETAKTALRARLLALGYPAFSG
jgi:metallo-beta-lactamase family protein